MGVIEVVGLGPGDYNGLPLGTLHALKRGHVILRTRIHPLVERLESDLGCMFESFDDLYETGDDFDVIYRQMAETVLAKAQMVDSVIYAVPGHPLVAEQSVQYLLAADAPGVDVKIGSGQSFFDVACSTLRIDPIEGLALLDGTTLTTRMLNPCVHTLIAQVYHPSVATDVKLTLMECFPDDYEVVVLRAAGVAGEEKVERIQLFELDRFDTVDHLTTIYVPPIQDQMQRGRDLWESVEIVRRLREPDGCPWDRKQTHESLRKYVIEEAFEVAEAIDEGDTHHLLEELGDLVLQVLLHAQIAQEFGEFSIRDVFASLAEKLLRRHPHVFGEASADNVEEANAVWDAVKQSEDTNLSESPPKKMRHMRLAGPALMVAADVQETVAKLGFDWVQLSDVLEKIKEEMNELEAEFRDGTPSVAAPEELGDLMFACVNLSRWMGMDAEVILTRAIRKFVDRFSILEDEVENSARGWSDFDVDELDSLWKKAKIAQRHKN